MAAMTPTELISMPTPKGFKALKPKRIELLPANSTSDTAYRGSSNNRILFNIPAYVSSFMNVQRSYFSFKGQCVNTGTPGDEVRFKDGVPVIERLVIKSNGLLLSDCREYAEIERILNNFGSYAMSKAKAWEKGDYRTLMDEMTATNANAFETLQSAKQMASSATYNGAKGHTFRKYLSPATIMTTDKMLPLGLLSASGGYALQVEMYLAPAVKCVEPTGTQKAAALAAAAGYETSGDYNYLKSSPSPNLEYWLDDVKFNLELLELPADIYADFTNQLLMGGKFILPFTTFRSHKHYLAGGSQHNLNVSEAAKNVEVIYSVMREQNSNSLEFLGGKESSVVQVDKVQWRYGTAYFPQSLLEADAGNGDKAFLEHALCGLDMLESHDPILSSMNNTTGFCRWEDKDFVLVNSFRSSKDRIDNGISTLSSGAPLQMTINFRSPVSSPVEILTFVEETMEMIIGQGGQISLVE